MPWSTPKQPASARGYGIAHQRERKRWAAIVAQGDAVCCLCGTAVEPAEPWHLDHTPDRTAYRGVAHAGCNVRDGARRGRAKQTGTSRPHRLAL